MTELLDKAELLTFVERIEAYNDTIADANASKKEILAEAEAAGFNKKGINITNEPTIRIFIMTHKDFKNYRYNPAYNIVFNGNNPPKEKYDLEVFIANNTRLSKMNRAYGEMT